MEGRWREEDTMPPLESTMGLDSAEEVRREGFTSDGVQGRSEALEWGGWGLRGGIADSVGLETSEWFVVNDL